MGTTAPSEFLSCGIRIGAEASGPMRSSRFTADKAGALHERLHEDGYLLLRGLLAVEDVLGVRRHLLVELSNQGFLDASRSVDEAVLASGSGFAADKFGERAAPVHEPAFERLLRRGALPAFFESFLGGPVRNLDRTILRARAGDQWSATYPHCDSVFMGRGTTDLYTAWIPLGEIGYALGGLAVLEGSHRSGSVLERYASRDVDEFCANRPAEAEMARTGQRPWDGKFASDPAAAQAQLGGRWVTAHYQPGDAVIFPLYTIHASTDNQTDRIRLSLDTRYQRADQPVDQRWVGDQRHRPTPKLRGRIC
ncbi:MAG: phytanoyl-CoA dioxygenase family protein [Mycobacterium sp.]|uniref:phytanoyl-CoA dioxygenase family protein n=1 Tax=Mycobacterium sp. TaxID=1785 RepID=UPI003C584D12